MNGKNLAWVSTPEHLGQHTISSCFRAVVSLIETFEAFLHNVLKPVVEGSSKGAKAFTLKTSDMYCYINGIMQWLIKKKRL